MSESPSNSFASCATCDRATDVRALWRKRPRDGFVRFSIWSLTALVTAAWAMGGFSFSNWFSARRLENAKRFISQDAAPQADSVTEWASDLWSRHGAHGLMATLAISVLAIVLAAIWALCLAPLTSRVVMSRDPWVKEGSHPALRFVRQVVRLFCIALRAIPEYVLAFLLLAILGQGAWPAVLALALHNAGILGRLGGETLENLERKPMRALRGL
ncbi:MAG: ABC transporter permease subunit, partial [Planctomycetes bacterium]|nr:ABC transporter permease subunit [Planctomycetota bacterium]